ncbi:hypothetical protein Daus18300_004655 [Diaporthe australafricana]|uniref:Uncharacterized protein n=1 Tax=Diaporthe australafricana TaxID=127596 RepID=A0ABR3X746_9PEZI
MPDTGAVVNAISEDYALSIGAVIKRPPHQNDFTNAKNRKFKKIGETQLVVLIPDTDMRRLTGRKWTCSFAVVKQLAAPLVIGLRFLRMTQTYTKLAHLLVKKTLSVFHDHLHGLKRVWRIMHMDLLTQKMACYLDDRAIFAALDSGSDKDVVSLDYASSRNWKTIPLPDGEGYVMLANSELVKLIGYIEKAFQVPGGYLESRRFYVLDGLASDVVLGDPTIEALDLFNNFKGDLIDLDTAEDMDCFHMIQWVETIDKMGEEVEQILSGSFDPPPARVSRTTGWKSFLGIKSVEKKSLANNSGRTLCN